jgi:alpha-N-acetylglucosamine transferase
MPLARTRAIWLLLLGPVSLVAVFFAFSGHRQPKYAFATLLAGATSDGNVSDPYFVATRMLTYQLLHAYQTRSRQHIPFLVAVLPDYDPGKRTRLRLDGATVVEVEPIDNRWATPDEDR